MNQFYVGQKVVFIGTGSWKKVLQEDAGVSVPERDNIYTIREMYIDPWNPNLVGIRLVEIVNPLRLYLGADRPIERGWCPHEFRPLQEKKTDISVFTRMLNKVPVEA